MHQEDDRESKRGDGQKGTGMFVMFDKNYVFFSHERAKGATAL